MAHEEDVLDQILTRHDDVRAARLELHLRSCSGYSGYSDCSLSSTYAVTTVTAITAISAIAARLQEVAASARGRADLAAVLRWRLVGAVLLDGKREREILDVARIVLEKHQRLVQLRVE